MQAGLSRVGVPASRTAARRSVAIASALRARALDVAFALVAFLFAAPSLGHPFGHDQAVHFYIGREWLRGALPYREAFDYKPPAIYALHAALAATFGDAEWPIRLADLVACAALATACWRLLSARPRGSLGATMLATAIANYGFFSFWDTAQCELYAVTFAMWSIVVAGRGRALLAGALLGCAFVTKSPAILFAPIALLRLPAPRRVREFLALAAGAVGVPALVLGFLALEGGASEIAACAEALGGATVAYVVGARRVDSLAALFKESVAMAAWFNPYGTLLLGGVAARVLSSLSERRITPSLRRHALAIACAFAAFASIVVQLKFYRYHWVTLVPALVLASGEVVLDLRERLTPRALHAAVGMFVLAYALSGEPSRWWWASSSDAVDLVRGAPRERVLARHVIAPLFYDRVEIARVSAWVGENTSPDDAVLARAFVPEVYVLAHRRAHARFFWPIPLTDRLRSYHLDAWRAADEREIATAAPEVVIANGNVHSGPESAEYFAPLGYAPATTIGRLVVLRRQRAGPTSVRSSPSSKSASTRVAALWPAMPIIPPAGAQALEHE